MVKRAPAKKLASALLKKGYQVGCPQLSVGRSLPLSLHDGDVLSMATLPACTLWPCRCATKRRQQVDAMKTGVIWRAHCKANSIQV